MVLKEESVNAVFLKGFIGRGSCQRPFCTSDALMRSPGNWLLLPALNHRQQNLIQLCRGTRFVSGEHLVTPIVKRKQDRQSCQIMQPWPAIASLWAAWEEEVISTNLLFSPSLLLFQWPKYLPGTQPALCLGLGSQQGQGNREQAAENASCRTLFKATTFA